MGRPAAIGGGSGSYALAGRSPAGSRGNTGFLIDDATQHSSATPTEVGFGRRIPHQTLIHLRRRPASGVEGWVHRGRQAAGDRYADARTTDDPRRLLGGESSPPRRRKTRAVPRWTHPSTPVAGRPLRADPHPPPPNRPAPLRRPLIRHFPPNRPASRPEAPRRQPPMYDISTRSCPTLSSERSSE